MKTCFYAICEKYNFLKWIFLCLFLLTIGTHFILSLESAVQSSELSSGVTEQIVTVIEEVTNQPIDHETAHSVVRKLVGHFMWFGLIGIFGALTFRFFMIDKDYGLMLFISMLTGFGLSNISELCQTIPSGRSCEIRDVLIDFSGYMVAFFIFLIIDIVYYYIHKRKEKKTQKA